MMGIPELHFSSKDFALQWYSGTGKGGQHRNKHQNCCRIIHIATGLRATGARSRDRIENQRFAFQNLAKKLVAFYSQPEERRSLQNIVRTYHFERSEALDHSTGLRLGIRRVIDGDLELFLSHPDRGRITRESGRA